MAGFSQHIDQLKSSIEQNKETMMDEIIKSATAAGYTVEDVDIS